MAIATLVTAPSASDRSKADCVAILEELLAGARSGKIEQLACVHKRADGKWGVDITTTTDFPSMIGRIEALKFRALLDFFQSEDPQFERG